MRLFEGTPFTVKPCDCSQRETVAMSSAATPNRCPYSAAEIHLWKFGEVLSVRESTNSLAARSCSGERFNWRIMSNCRSSETSPRSFLMFASGRVFPASRTSLLSSSACVINGRRPAVWAMPMAPNTAIRPATASVFEPDFRRTREAPPHKYREGGAPPSLRPNITELRGLLVLNLVMKPVRRCRWLLAEARRRRRNQERVERETGIEPATNSLEG